MVCVEPAQKKGTCQMLTCFRIANPEVPNSEVLAMLLDNMESLGLVKLEPHETDSSTRGTFRKRNAATPGAPSVVDQIAGFR